MDKKVSPSPHNKDLPILIKRRSLELKKRKTSQQQEQHSPEMMIAESSSFPKDEDGQNIKEADDDDHSVSINLMQ